MARIASSGLVLFGLLLHAAGSTAADTPAKKSEIDASRELVAASKSMPADILAVGAFKGLTDLIKEVDEVCKGSGHPEWSQKVTVGLEAFSAGIDRTKPLGVAVMVRDNELIPVGMIPVTDVALALRSASGIFGPARDENGLKRIGPVLVKSAGGYAFVASQAAHLEKLPDPAKLLAPLVGKKGVALAFFPQRLPEAMMEQFTSFMDLAAEARAQKRGGGNELKESIELLNSQRKMAEWQALVEGARLVGVEISVDAPGKKIALDVTVLPEAGTELEDAYKLNLAPTSAFAPLTNPTAAFFFQQSRKMVALDEEDNKTVDEVFEGLAESLREELIDENLPKAQQDERNKLVDDGLKLFKAFSRDQSMDGVLVASRPAEWLEVVGAMKVPDGKAFDAFAQKLCVALAKNLEVKSFKASQAKHRGADIHTLVLVPPAPPAKAGNDAGLKQVFGTTDMIIHFACTPDTVWVLAGPASWKSLTEAMDKCAAAPQRVPLQRFTVALAPMARIAFEITKSAELKTLTDSLAPTEGLRAVEIAENGIGLTRLEIDFALIRGMATAMQMIGQ